MDTNESYVTYEAAKQLKSIGFSELCHTTYDTTTLDREWQVHTGQHVLLSNKISCPNQVQVIDWFIQKYKLFIQVTYETVDGKYGYFCTIVEIGEFENGEPVTRVDNSCYDTRSQATNRGIDMCIGLVLQRMSEKKFDAHSMEDVFRILDENIDEESKEYLLRHGALLCHNTIGRWIRNTFELWTLDESNPKLYQILFENGYDHPDDMSNFILEEYIKHLTDLNSIPDEDYVPYEILSKIIRKGFPAMTSTEWYGCGDGKKHQETINKNHYPKVTQHQVLKWLIKKHDIFVNVSILDEDERQIFPDKEKKKFYWSIYKYSTGEIRPYDGCGLTEFEIINDAITLCADVLL